MTDYQFKIALEQVEFEQIHRLNYRTFVEEIPQHQPNPERRLVDKFHAENCYLICLAEDCLAGMVAIRDQRPFSLDEKLPDLDSYLPPFRSICEIRLLAIEPQHRNGTVFGGLLQTAFTHRLSQGYDLAVMSGTVRQLKLYKRLGFIPFGPLVGPPEAQYQPMYWTMGHLRKAVPWLKTINLAMKSRQPFQHIVNLLPGPVAVRPKVQAAFEAPAISHRLPGFVADVQTTKRMLSDLTKARSVELFMGGGTLANDVIAFQLRMANEPGLVLANGEFGCRLLGHAQRAGLKADALIFEWGETFDYDLISQNLSAGRYSWLWTTHCETASGILNDLPKLRSLCQQSATNLCLDAVSTIGLMPVDLSDIYLASGVSGKGLASLSGLAMVFYNHSVEPQPHAIPSCLDLGAFAVRDGVPFTVSSNLLYGLKAALEQLDIDMHFASIQQLSSWCRTKLAELDIPVLVAEEYSAPAVLSLALPEHVDSYETGILLRENGYLLSFASPYLQQSNVLQICLFSHNRQEQLWLLFQLLEQAIDL